MVKPYQLTEGNYPFIVPGYIETWYDNSLSGVKIIFSEQIKLSSKLSKDELTKIFSLLGAYYYIKYHGVYLYAVRA